MAEYIELGLAGLFIASFLAATILPLSSEAVLVAMLAAGFSPVHCLLVATVGNWLGGITSYYLGYIGNWRILNKWFKTREATVLKYKRYADKYGSWLALLCWTPIVGDVIAIALGFFRVKTIPVLVFMLIGKLARYVAIICLLDYFF